MSKQSLERIAACAAMCFSVYAMPGVNQAAAAPPSILPPLRGSSPLVGAVGGPAGLLATTRR
jgi:hypothetical protein